MALTLSTGLFIKCLLFLKETFHSHVLMGLGEFWAYMSNVVLASLTEALFGGSLSAGMCQFLARESWQTLRTIFFLLRCPFLFSLR